jgi:alkyl sulfatase BDS1-like metallo-beta-lactamase superfamily hydrolase
MEKVRKWWWAGTLVVAALFTGAWFLWTERLPAAADKPGKQPTPAGLLAHTREFDREIIKVAEGVYCAVGYGLANSILIEGKDSLVVVDVLESNEAARKLKADFDKISNKPIAALIYTHNHTDHTSGGEGFVQEQQVFEVYAHATTATLIDQQVNLLRPITTRRAMRMFGNALADRPDLHVNCGIGHRLELDGESTMTTYRPTITFDKRMQVKISGVDIELIHAPGETSDQIFVWLPAQRALICADNLYRAFPNLYTIRGTPYRDVAEWMRSLDIIREIAPDVLIPCHSRPVAGKAEILSITTAYRDAIQFVHDQTIRNLNKGLGPEEAAEVVRLPPHLAQHPYLQEYYGKAEWSVKNIFNGYLGFFDGNPTHLHPLPPIEKAGKIAALAGGEKRLQERCLQALKAKEYQWALELSDYLLRLDPRNREAREIRRSCLLALGARESNPNARHYYYTTALEMDPAFQLFEPGLNPSSLRQFPLSAFFASLACNLVPEKSLESDVRVLFKFEDTGEVFTLHVRRGICEVQHRALPDPQLVVRLDADTWKACLARLKSLPASVLKGDIAIEQGSRMAFLSFMGMFAE